MMKNLFSLAVVVLMMLQCAAKQQYYHSTASIPRYNQTTKSYIIKIRGDEKYYGNRGYGVFACTDSVSTYYLLMAPDKHNKLIIERAVTLMPSDAKEMIDIVNASISSWNNEIQLDHGLFYEYICAPEQNIYHMSENANEWYPTLKFLFRLVAEGSEAKLSVGDERFVIPYTYRFDDLESLKDLSNILIEALKELEKMGYKE